MGVTLIDCLKYCVYSDDNGNIYHIIRHENEFFISYKKGNRHEVRRFSSIDELKSWNKEIGDSVGSGVCEKRV